MAKRKRTAVSQKILDAWVPPEGAGEPLGCLATTFTFDPAFFEEDCLSRFLRLETDPREDGAAYLINREEKLAVSRVCVLVDRSHVEGSASARWDVLPVNPPSGIFHPKLAILAWHNWIRLIIGSANLTEPAYRKNQEIFGVLDFYDGSIAPLDILARTLQFVEGVLPFCPGAPEEPGPKLRLFEFLRYLGELSREWQTKPLGIWDSAQAEAVFLGPIEGFNDSVLGRLGQMMRSHGGPAHSAWVLSPFFDQSAEKVYPVTNELLSALTDRGSREVSYLVSCERLPDGRLRLRAPRSLIGKARKTADYRVYPVDEEVENEVRPLHAKSIWLWNDRWHIYMIGSSNFTSAGLGLPGHSPNFEANLAYTFREGSKIVEVMDGTLPPYEDPVDDFEKILWEAADVEQGEEMAVGAVLPSGFEEALFEPGDEQGTLELRFGSSLPESWTVHFPVLSASVYSSDEWSAARKPSKVRIPWTHKAVPNGVDVHWVDASQNNQSAIWPVNVTDPRRLPPPDDLRNLPLDTLLEILCSGRPLYEIVPGMKNSGNERTDGAAESLPDELNPLKRFSSETFLLQRTRRVAKAIERLVENLSRPIVHRDVLNWRLRGPAGPLALAAALCKESRTRGEASFLLTEVVLALTRIDITKMAAGMDEKEVRIEIAGVISDVKRMIVERLKAGEMAESMAGYITKALQEAEQ